MREFSDLDLLVSEKDLHKAEKIILARKYRLFIKSLDENEEGFRLLNGSKIDLHWKVAPRGNPFETLTAELFKYPRTLKISGCPIMTFSADNFLITLCAHASKHDWVRLSWIADFAHFIHTQNVDLPKVMRRLEKIGCQKILLEGLFLAQELAGLEIKNAHLRKKAAGAVPAERLDFYMRRLFKKDIINR